MLYSKYVQFQISFKKFSFFLKIIGLLLVSIVLFYPKSYLLFAASITSTSNIFFGRIIADPSGENIEIDASLGTAIPRKATGGVSNVTGGVSGLIRIYSKTAGWPMHIVYPASISITNGSNTMKIDGISIRSVSLPTTVVGFVDIHVGGLLHISQGQSAGSYAGSMLVTVNYL